MKIACVGYLHGAGGAERQIIMLANALAELNHEVYLIVMAEYKSKYLISNKVIVFDMSIYEKNRGNKILNRYYTLKKIYMDISPDVSIHFWLQSAYLSAFMPAGVRGKIIYAERGDPGDSEYNGLIGIIRMAAFKKIDGFVFQSEGARDYFNDDITKRAVVIHNAVAVPEDKYLKPCLNREKKIVTVGRLHPQKNQKILIDAFAKLSNDFSEFYLEIYGDGELKKILEKQIAYLNMGDKIRIYPSRKDIFDCIYNASMFVLTSDYEGMPNALMEAMALGVPCISTDCKPGGSRTLIKDGVNGYIVPVGNVDALKRKMEQILHEPQRSDSLGKNAQKIRESHKEEVIFKQWDNYIKQLVGG